ncbi:MAG: glycosyltransferase family 39 protein [Chloroflexi bacterium]|nr:glycosyltransferase family 39 protein [Chloroflexota bacterium]
MTGFRRPTVSMENAARVAALALVLAAFAIRIYRLDAAGLEGDEAFSIQAAYTDVASIIRTAATTDPHPPLYYLFLRLWYVLTGTAEFTLRYPSVLAGVLVVAGLVRLAEVLSWRFVGLLSAALFTLSPFAVRYAQEARMYALVTLLGLLALCCLLRALAQGRSRFLALYALSMLLSLYTHYYASFLFALTSVLLLAELRARRAPRAVALRWAGVQLTIVALFIPWVVLASDVALSHAPSRRATFDLAGWLTESLLRYTVGFAAPTTTSFALAAGFLALAATGWWFAGRGGDGSRAWFRRSFVAGYALLPMALGILSSLYQPMFAARYVMVSAPAFSLLLGLGVAGCHRASRPLGVAAGLFLVSVEAISLGSSFFDDAAYRSDFREAAAYIRELTQPGDAIVLDGWSQLPQFWYYYTLRVEHPVPSYLFPTGEPEGHRSSGRRLDEIMARHQGVWLLDYDVASHDPLHVVEAHLAGTYYQAFSHRLRTNRVVYYASSATAPSSPVVLNVSCNQEILLEEFRGPRMAEPGQILPLDLQWRALKKPAGDYAVSWRLLDPAGRTIVQRDARPAAGFSPTPEWTADRLVIDRYGMLLPTYAPPGLYSLAAAVYDRATGAACQLRQGDRALPGDVIPLGQVDVLDVVPAAARREPAPAQAADFRFGALRLLGFDADGRSVRSGNTATIRLYWQVAEDPGRDYRLVARLTTERGEILQEQEGVLGPAWFPSGRWRGGRTILTHLDVPIPSRLATGQYRLSMALKADGLDEQTFSGFPTLTVVSRERTFKVPAIANPIRARFGELIELLGYEVRPASTSGIGSEQQIQLTLYWRALREMEVGYKVFTHLVGEDGQIYGQDDSVPLGGAAPTTSWLPGEVLTDAYRLTVRGGAPAGRYRLIAGFYDPERGTRIPLADGSGDSLALTSFTLRGTR